MSSNNDFPTPQLFLILAIALFALVWFAFRSLASALGLDIGTTVKVTILSAFTISIWIFLLWSSRQDWAFLFTDLPIWSTLPLVVMIVSICWWPAIDYWADEKILSAGFRHEDIIFAPTNAAEGLPWYLGWKGKTLWLVLPYSIYFLIKRFVDRE